MLNKDRKITLCFLYIVSFGILCAIYKYYINPTWEYYGFVFHFDWMKFIASVGVLLTFVMITPIRVDVRSFFLNLALTIHLLPSLVLYSLGGKPTSSAMVMWIALLVVYAASAMPLRRLKLPELDQKRLMQGLALATGSLIVALFIFGGARNFNLDLRLVYEFRGEIAESLPVVFSFLIPIFSKSIIPFGIILAGYYNNIFLVASYIVASMLLFGLSSHKSIVLYPLLAVGAFYLLRKFNKYSYVLYIFIFAISIGFIDVAMREGSETESFWGWYASLMVRRALMTPSIIDYYYIDFFSHNPYFFWSSSRLSLGLVEPPYDLTPPFLIGEAYFGSSQAGANTGYIGSGFAQAGMAGVVLYSFGVGVTLAILQSYGRYLGLPFVASITTTQVVTMISSTDFVTLFLTHGMLISLVLLAMARPLNPGR